MHRTKTALRARLAPNVQEGLLEIHQPSKTREATGRSSFAVLELLLDAGLGLVFLQGLVRGNESIELFAALRTHLEVLGDDVEFR